jgi:hypothetical protein
VWLNCVQFEEDSLRVNMLLNHESRWATVKSWIPYQGYTEIIPRQAGELTVRLPEYIKPHQFRMRVAGEEVEPEFQGRWAILRTVKAGERVEVEFHMPIRKKRVTIPTPFAQARLEGSHKAKPVNYFLKIKGNVVVDCEPRGERYPYFVHPEYLQDQPSWKTVERVIPQKLPFVDGAVKIKTLSAAL